MQYYFGDSLSDLDALRHHALQQANPAHVQEILGRPFQRRSQALQLNNLQRLLAAEERDGGRHRASGNASWTAAELFDRQRSLALQVRLNLLPTRHRISLWYPARDLPQSCPLCSAPKDTAGHRLGACMHPRIKQQICARHGHAVQAAATEIRAGVLGNCAMLIDINGE